jgi:RNA polymerase sigma-70 factor (ECF subfamily)
MAMEGDRQAVEELGRTYARIILYQVNLLCRDKNDVDDIANEVAIQMVTSLKDLRSPFAFRAWLQKVIERTVAKYNEEQRWISGREVQLDEAELMEDQDRGMNPEVNAEITDFGSTIGKYLEQLPQSQSQPLLMFYYEDMTYTEIAEALELSAGTVSGNIAKAKKHLQRLMEGKMEGIEL